MTSNISWLDRPGYLPEVWNFLNGCTKISKGCRHCYAEAVALRFHLSALPWTAANAAQNVIFYEKRLEKPLHWREPRMVFVNSMADLFHDLVPNDVIERAFCMMEATPRHTYIILTKRPVRALNQKWWPDNVWMGVSIESSHELWRLGILGLTKAKVKLVSFEPLLGPIDRPHLGGIDWVIAGGESGIGYRPMDMQWARDIRDASQRAGAAFYFKQVAHRFPGRGALEEVDGSRWLWRQWPGLMNPPTQEEGRHEEAREGGAAPVVR